MSLAFANKIKLIRDDYPIYPTVEVMYVGRPLLEFFLQAKLVEEAAEIADAPWDVEEYADLLQVFVSLLELRNFKFDHVVKVMEAKAKRLGTFSEGKVAYTTNPFYKPRPGAEEPDLSGE